MCKYLLGSLCSLGLLVSAAPVCAEALEGVKKQVRTTTVRSGEDCQSIVKRVYGTSPGAMARFHAANPQLGGLPHVLTAGDTVYIPESKNTAGRRKDPQKTKAEPPRLSYVGPDVRTQGQGGFTEALPEQPLSRRTRIVTGESGGAEINLQENTRLQLLPKATMTIDSLPQKKSAGAVSLLDGTLRAGIETEGAKPGDKAPPKAAPLTVRTPAAEIKLRGGGARIEAEELPGGKPLSLVSVYEGSVAVRAKGSEVMVPAGQGTLIIRGEKPAMPQSLLSAPTFPDGRPLLVPALVLGVEKVSDSGKPSRRGKQKRPQASPAAVPVAQTDLVFSSVPGAEQYLVEVARDQRFNDRRGGGEIVASPLPLSLPPGTYVARVSAIDGRRLHGPASVPKVIHSIEIRSDLPLQAGEPAEPGKDRVTTLYTQEKSLTLKVHPPQGLVSTLQVRLDDRLLPRGSTGYELMLTPGPHRVLLSQDGAIPAEVQISVGSERFVPPNSPPDLVEPQDLPVPLTTAGFWARAVHPRTRAYALFSLGSSAATARLLDVVRFDLGGEFAFFSNRVSVDLNLPLLYFEGPTKTGAALGDLSLGFRALAYTTWQGRLALGPLLRLGLPSATYTRPDEPGSYPVILDPAFGVALTLGRFGFLSTQGPTAVLAVAENKLRWSMTYVAQMRIWRASLALELGAALGMLASSSHGATLGGGGRIAVDRSGHFRVLAGARGGLGVSGEALFGRYQVNLGAEWVR